jgi:DNA-binding NarL/FixJ family response regulator
MESTRELDMPISSTLPKRILLVDDHDLVRSALRGMLDRDGAFEVVGECANAEEALHTAFGCTPDILLIDIDMPGMICFDAVRQMVTRLPNLSVIFLSAFYHDHYIEQALKVGAKGYVLKGDPPSILFAALREVAAGGAYFSAEVRARFALDKDGKVTGEGRTVTSTLTNREVEVLRYLARGLSKKEIAKTMHLSVKTVEHHSSSVMRKLDIHDRVELARYAIREGLAEA